GLGLSGLSQNLFVGNGANGDQSGNISATGFKGGGSASTASMGYYSGGVSIGSAQDFGFSSASAANSIDTVLDRVGANQLAIGSTHGDTTGSLKLAGVISAGTKFTTTGCSISSTTGGATAGKFTLGANTCTVVIT